MKTIDQPRPKETDPLSGGGSDQIERIRAKLYDFVSQNPSGEQADKARQILGKLPKIKTPADIEALLSPTSGVLPSGERLHMGEFADILPTRDEELGLDKGLQKPGLGIRAVSTVGNPHERREFVRGVDDMVAFGAGQALARQVEKVAPTSGSESPESAVKSTIRRIGVPVAADWEGGFTEEGSALDRQRAPNYREGGRLLGSLLPGATQLTLRGAGAVTSPLVGRIASTGMPGQAFGGMLSGAAANTIGMPLIAGGQAAVRGENPLPVMQEEIQNPINPIVGGAVGIPVGVAKGIRAGNTQTGRDIRLVEEYGATPTPFGGAKGGQFEAPIMKGAEGSTREAGSLARRASREVLGGLEGEQKALSSEYAASKAAAGEAGQLEGLVRPDYVLDEAKRLLGSQRLTRAQKAQIETEVNDVLAAHPKGLPVDDFNDFRAKLADMADFGESGAAKHPALGNLFTAAKNAIDETEMGPINLKYHTGKEALQTKYNQLKLRQGTDPRVAEERVAGQILRRGENTPTAGIQEPAIEEFLAANPRYRPLFDSISLLNAKERMGLGLMSHGGSLYTRMHGALEHNLEPLGVGAYRLGGALQDKGAAASLAAQYLLRGEQQ